MSEMSKLIAILRKIYIHELNEQVCNNPGINTRINLYLVEVQILKAFVYIITGRNPEDESNSIHDACCSFIDIMHNDYDA